MNDYEKIELMKAQQDQSYLARLLNQLEKKEARLKLATEALEFYAGLSWDGSRIEASDVSREIIITHHYVTLGDLPEDITSVSMGGKRARQALEQIKKG